MVVFLLKAIFSSIAILLNVVSCVLFTTLAYFLMSVIQAFRIPNQALQGVLQWLGEAVKGFMKSILLFFVGIVSNLVSTLFDLVKDGVLGSFEAASSGLACLNEQTKASLAGLFEGGPELVRGLPEFAWKILADLWNNYKEAFGYASKDS